MTDYTPVDCALYSGDELAVVQGRRLRVSWRRPGGQLCVELLRPLDLQTRNHEEFLVAEDPMGSRVDIRLDQIHKTEAL